MQKTSKLSNENGDVVLCVPDKSMSLGVGCSPIRDGSIMLYIRCYTKNLPYKYPYGILYGEKQD